jgi:hypothetical protein
MINGYNDSRYIYYAENTMHYLMLLILFKMGIDILKKNSKKTFGYIKKGFIFASAIGEMAEWSNAAVLKTVEGHTSGGSNPSFSAETSFK